MYTVQTILLYIPNGKFIIIITCYQFHFQLDTTVCQIRQRHFGYIASNKSKTHKNEKIFFSIKIKGEKDKIKLTPIHVHTKD